MSARRSSRHQVPPRRPPARLPEPGKAAVGAGAAERARCLRRTLAALLAQDEVTIVGRAVATLVDTGPVCMLSLRGTFLMGGNSNVAASGCVLASNRRGGPSIDVSGSATISALSLRAAGECQGCSATSRVLPPTRFTENETPVPDPFAALNAITYPDTSKNPVPRPATVAWVGGWRRAWP